MTTSPTSGLGKREREIMDIVFRLGEASVADVRDAMEEPPSYSSVRTMLAYLEKKGHLRHRQEGPRYVYQPTLDATNARRSALRHLIDTFFDGSAEAMVTTLVENPRALGSTDLEDLRRVIEEARRERER